MLQLLLKLVITSSCESSMFSLMMQISGRRKDPEIKHNYVSELGGN